MQRARVGTNVRLADRSSRRMAQARHCRYVQVKNARRLWVMPQVILLAACVSPQREQTAAAIYNKDTGKLSQLTVSAQKDGNPNITSYMDGDKFLRIEIDRDEDGKVDRWEYYGPDQKLEKVGFSRSNDGVPDAWAFEDASGTISRLEISTRGDGRPNRTEFYERNTVVRAEEDTNGDGLADKWETYANGELATVSFDLKKSGKPTATVDYRK